MGIYTVVIAIVLIMFMARKRINIGLAMLAGSAVLILLMPMSWDQFVSAAETAFINELTWELAAAVVLIGTLGHLLKASGALDTMVNRLLRLMGDPRWLMVVLPGLIGALSVPGGAMMSAPIVDQLGDTMEVNPDHKTGINIIYRHIWYIVFPIIPSLVLAASLAGLTPQELAVLNIPALVIGLVVAWFWLLQRLPGKPHLCWNGKDFAMFILSIMPLIVVIFLYLVVGLNFAVSLLFGLVLALFNLPEQGQGNLASRMWATGMHRAKTMLLPGFRPQLLLVVAGIMLFKELIFVSDIINIFAEDLMGLGIPLWLLLLFLPLLVGLSTGSHEAAVGIAIPVFVPLLSEDTFMAGIGLTYIAATMGYLSSPLHLCIILTREYFNAKFSKVYRYIAPVTLTMLVTGLITALIRGL